MDLSKLKINDCVLFLDGTVAKVINISQNGMIFHIYFNKMIRGDDDTTSTTSNNWFYTKAGLWGYKPGVGNDIIKILEDNNESD
jgi:hypothetical protein